LTKIVPHSVSATTDLPRLYEQYDVAVLLIAGSTCCVSCSVMYAEYSTKIFVGNQARGQKFATGEGVTPDILV